MSKQLNYCIQWTNSRGKTHFGPKLLTNLGDYLGDFNVEALLDHNQPLPTPPESKLKTLSESQALANTMNNSPEFNNQSHKVVIFGRRKQKAQYEL